MKSHYLGRIDLVEKFFNRKMDLIRGEYMRWRGAKVGSRFGVGKGTCLLYPAYFTAGIDVSIGDLSYLNCLSNRGVKIGNHTSIDRNLWLHCGGSINELGKGFFEIGDYSYIGCNGVMGAGGGGIKIGNNVLIGQSVNIHAENHIYDDPSRLIRDQGITYNGIVIEDNVWIGSKATILDGVKIGTGVVVGAGAVVTKSVPPYCVVVGIPAHIIRRRSKEKHENRDIS